MVVIIQKICIRRTQKLQKKTIVVFIKGVKGVGGRGITHVPSCFQLLMVRQKISKI